MTSRTSRLLRSICVTGVALTALGPLLAPVSAGAAGGPSAASAVAAPAASTPTAMALSLRRRTVEREGRCRRGRGEWDLKVERRPRGRLYVEFEVDEIGRHQRWHLFVANRGHRVASVTRNSRLQREVRVRRLTRNRRGRDRIRAAAVNPRTGVTCRARLRF